MDLAMGRNATEPLPASVSTADVYFSDLQKAMLDASPDCIKMLSVDGKLQSMNKAGCLALGVPVDQVQGLDWVSLLSPDVHDAARAALAQASVGQNARFSGKSIEQGVVTYWDNMLSPFVAGDGSVFVIMCVSRDITQQRQLEHKLEEAARREHLVAREHQHRVKNLLSIVSGLIFIAEKEARAQGSVSVGQLLREKIGALARASDVAFARAGEDETTDGRIDLTSVVDAVLQPYGKQCSFGGSHTSLNSSGMTTIALILHELATNSVKYGALSTTDGGVSVRWTVSDGKLHMHWAEVRGPRIILAPDRLGFGSEMADRIIRSAGGNIQRNWHDEGLVVDIDIPILHIA